MELKAVAATPTIRYAKGLHVVEDLPGILADDAKVAELTERLANCECLLVKRAIPKEPLLRIREYLTRVGQNSLPTYHKIEAGCPNFHRIIDRDPRSDVEGIFHQFVFHPWNQDFFDVFSLFRPVYRLKNRLAGLPADQYLGTEPVDGCTARVAFQFYPSGGGMLHRHCDPVGYHQLVVPTIVMSKRGEDYSEGGLYVERDDGTQIDVDGMADIGDAVYFQAEVVHGIALVDPEIERDWLSFRGRWMGLIAVNRVHSNLAVARSIDLERRDPSC
jgi:hypothetical protein